jgi:hypothetical protein
MDIAVLDMTAAEAETARRKELERHYIAEIERRGGETVIVGRYRDVQVTVTHEDPQTGLAVVRAEAWRKYGRDSNRYVSIAYLCGTDDGHLFAVRVAGRTTTVADALAQITPQAVKDALRAGKRVKRQGDIYAIETTTQYDGKGLDDLPASHRWNPATRYMTHRPDDGRRHRPVHVPWPARWVQQTAYQMGRSGSRGGAD